MSGRRAVLADGHHRSTRAGRTGRDGADRDGGPAPHLETSAEAAPIEPQALGEGPGVSLSSRQCGPDEAFFQALGSPSDSLQQRLRPLLSSAPLLETSNPYRFSAAARGHRSASLAPLGARCGTLVHGIDGHRINPCSGSFGKCWKVLAAHRREPSAVLPQIWSREYADADSTRMNEQQSKQEPAAEGRVVAVRGSIVDVRFPPPLPTRYRALRTGEQDQIVLEV